MSDDAFPHSEIILYQTEDGRTRVQCRFENETVWLTQAQIAELFETTPQNITLHLKSIFAESELVEAATCKDYLQVRQEGSRGPFRDRPRFFSSQRRLSRTHITTMPSANIRYDYGKSRKAVSLLPPIGAQ